MSIQQDVQAAFAAAVHSFNNYNLGILMDYVDAEATVFSVSGGIAYYTKHAVRAYFVQEFVDKPIFTPATYTPIVLVSPTGIGASITDHSTWQDNKRAKYPMIYAFTFVYRPNNPSPTNNWLLSSMWGS